MTAYRARLISATGSDHHLAAAGSQTDQTPNSVQHRTGNRAVDSMHLATEFDGVAKVDLYGHSASLVAVQLVEKYGSRIAIEETEKEKEKGVEVKRKA